MKSSGTAYWTPEIIQTTWAQAETAKIPVSGAGYGGKFSGYGFDSMWTDMFGNRSADPGRKFTDASISSSAVDIGIIHLFSS